MKLTLPVLENTELNCRLACVMTILSYHGMDYHAIFCNTLCFSYQKGKPLQDDYIYYGNLKEREDLLEVLYGMKLNSLVIPDQETLSQMVRITMDKGHIPLIRGRIYNCPYNTRQFPDNYPHYSLVSAIQNDGSVYMDDPYLNIYSRHVGTGAFFNYMEDFLIYTFESGHKTYPYESHTELLKLSVDTLKQQANEGDFFLGVRNLAEAFTETEQFLSLLSCDKDTILKLVNVFMGCKFHTIAYIEFIKNVLQDHDMLPEIINSLEKVTILWSEVSSLVLKAYIKKAKHDEIRKLLYLKLVIISNTLESVLDSLQKVCCS